MIYLQMRILILEIGLCYLINNVLKNTLNKKNTIRHLYRITIKLEYKLEYLKLDRDKSTFKSHRDFDSEIEMTFKHF